MLDRKNEEMNENWDEEKKMDQTIQQLKINDVDQTTVLGMTTNVYWAHHAMRCEVRIVFKNDAMRCDAKNLYRSQISQPDTHRKALGEIYQIYIPLHLSDLKNSANFRRKFWWHFHEFQAKSLKFCNSRADFCWKGIKFIGISQISSKYRKKNHWLF